VPALQVFHNLGRDDIDNDLLPSVFGRSWDNTFSQELKRMLASMRRLSPR